MKTKKSTSKKIKSTYCAYCGKPNTIGTKFCDGTCAQQYSATYWQN